MANINLLPVEERERESFQLLKQRLSILSAVFLILVAAFTLGVLIFFTSVVSKIACLVAQVEENVQAINSFKATEEFAVVVKDKVQIADKILGARIDYFETFNQLAKLIPQNVNFNEVKFAPDKVILSGKAKTSADLSGLIASLVSADGAKILSAVTVDSLTSDEAGVYSFSINAKPVSLGVK